MAGMANSLGRGRSTTKFPSFLRALNRNILSTSISRAHPRNDESADEDSFIIVTTIHFTPLLDTSFVCVHANEHKFNVKSPMVVKFPKGSLPKRMKKVLKPLVERPDWDCKVTHHHEDRHDNAASAEKKGSEHPGAQVPNPVPGLIVIGFLDLNHPIDMMFSDSVRGQITIRCEVIPKAEATHPNPNNASPSNIATDAEETRASANEVVESAVVEQGQVLGKRSADELDDDSDDFEKEYKSRRFTYNLTSNLSYRLKADTEEKPKNTQAPETMNELEEVVHGGDNGLGGEKDTVH